jgi:hypothetical protein
MSVRELHLRSLCLTLVLQMLRFIVLTCGLLVGCPMKQLHGMTKRRFTVPVWRAKTFDELSVNIFDSGPMLAILGTCLYFASKHPSSFRSCWQSVLFMA